MFTITFNDNYLYLINNSTGDVYFSRLEVPYNHFNCSYGKWFEYCNNSDEMKDLIKSSINRHSISICEKDFGFGPEFCINIDNSLFLPLNKSDYAFSPILVEHTELKRTNKRLREVNDDLTVQNKKLKCFDMDDNLIKSFENEIQRLIEENTISKQEYDALEQIDNQVIEDLIKENNSLKNKIDNLNQKVNDLKEHVQDLNDFISSIEYDIRQFII